MSLSLLSSSPLTFVLLYLYSCSVVLASVPQPFQITNLLRTIDLTKPYVRDSTALILENISNSTQTEFFWGVPLELVPKQSYLDVKEKKTAAATQVFPIELSNEDDSLLQLYKVQLPKVDAGEKISLVISSAYVDCLVPYPAVVAQDAKQYLLYNGLKHATTVYTTLKQKTKIKLPGEIKSYTKSKANADGESDPTVSGFILTYGPYDKHIPSTPPEQISVHYEYTAPIAYVEHLERDIEVSHWGNKVAIEERYILTNHAARLKDQFSRLQYTRNSYSSPPTHAITRLAVALKNGAKDAYYTDIIGNVSTSRFRAARGTADAHLEVQPRFPIYGGWNYTFRLGWNIDLERVQKIANGERILKVPFLEGPENIQYENFDITIVLPEGSRNVRVFTPQVAVSEERYLHRTFLDSLGRTAVKLHFENVVDEKRGKEVVVIYEYPRFAGLRKVVVVATGVLAIFIVRLVGGRIFAGGISGK